MSVVSDDDDKANVFGNYFAGVYTCEPVGEFTALPSHYPVNLCESVTFSEEVIT